MARVMKKKLLLCQLKAKSVKIRFFSGNTYKLRLAAIDISYLEKKEVKIKMDLNEPAELNQKTTKTGVLKEI